MGHESVPTRPPLPSGSPPNQTPDMSSDLHALFEHRVLKPYVAVRKWYERRSYGNQEGLRLVEQAATALYHFWENMPPDIRRDPRSLAEVESAYSLARDIANASKHGEITRANRPPVRIKGRQSLREAVYSDDHTDDEGTYQFTHAAVLVTVLDGSELDALELLTDVANMWCRILSPVLRVELGPFDHFRHEPTRANADRGEGLKITGGVKLDMVLNFRIFDAETSTFRNKDLSGYSSFEAVLRSHPPIQLTAGGTGPNGEDIKFEDQLTDEESRRFRDATDEGDKEWVLRRAVDDRLQALRQAHEAAGAPTVEERELTAREVAEEDERRSSDGGLGD